MITTLFLLTISIIIALFATVTIRKFKEASQLTGYLSDELTKASDEKGRLEERASELDLLERRLKYEESKSETITVKYFISESDLTKYSSQKLMERAIRKKLITSFADKVINHFNNISIDRGTSDGKDYYSISFKIRPL